MIDILPRYNNSLDKMFYFIYLSFLLCFTIDPPATGNNLGKVRKGTMGTENIVLVDLNFYYSGN